MTSNQLLERHAFREQALDRDGGQCLVPWCGEDADEVHHIIERSLWSDGGYYLNNGASVCNHHHQYAEENYIAPHSFWRWLGVEDIPVPEGTAGDRIGVPEDRNEQALSFPADGPGTLYAFNKWGEALDTPPHEDLRDFHKYPSSRHMLPLYWKSERGTAEERTGRDDTGLTDLEPFVGVPLVITEKMDGGNAMLVKDQENPVRARNGSQAKHQSFDLLKQLYWENDVYSTLPENLQVFGEWLYAKHSIHYGCDCDPECEDVASSLSTAVADWYDNEAYFQIFGIFDTRYNLWLSWPETLQWSTDIGFPTIFEYKSSEDFDRPMFEDKQTAKRKLLKWAEKTVDGGGEGIVVRSKFGFHYGQFGQRLGKYVRPDHVQPSDDHWKYSEQTQNKL